MNKPSSTITAASLAGAGVTLLWLMVDNFTDLSVSAGLISGSSGFVMALIGYLKKENVMNPGDK